MRPECKRFATMNVHHSNKLLDAFWNEENIDAIHIRNENGNKLKAYKFFDSEDVLDPALH